jgi:hypothetical protein
MAAPKGPSDIGIAIKSIPAVAELPLVNGVNVTLVFDGRSVLAGLDGPKTPAIVHENEITSFHFTTNTLDYFEARVSQN